ncbi:hypothetical protein C8R47DRAFT_1240179 [Mycena vitilis]|nr:hypothetical protein C8R47DRAFT_1240179 [Mycena vitilis]
MMTIPRSPGLEHQHNAVSTPTATQDVHSGPDRDLGDERSDTIFLSSPWEFGQDFSWLPLMPVNDYPESNSLTTQHADPSYQHAGDSDDYFARTHLRSDSAGSSPDASGNSSSSSAHDVPASPAYLHSELPIPTEMHYSYFLRRQCPDPPPYLGLYAGHQDADTESLMPSTYSYSAQESQSSQLRPHWDVQPTPAYLTLPSISQSRRAGVQQARLSSQSQSTSVRQFPTVEELRHWPQVFNREMNVASKKTVLACLFCRERKIGCVRPAEDDPDQTCNQCLRRQKICEYPKESHRGHHIRRRRSNKPRVSTVVPLALPDAL